MRGEVSLLHFRSILHQSNIDVVLTDRVGDQHHGHSLGLREDLVDDVSVETPDTVQAALSQSEERISLTDCVDLAEEGLQLVEEFAASIKEGLVQVCGLERRSIGIEDWSLGQLWS